MPVLVLGVIGLVNETCHAKNGGSFGGSSGGSWGSGSCGSSGGLLAGRRPVRNLLGRLGGRFHGSSGGSSGSYGSSGSTGSGVLNGGLLGRRSLGSTGGWSGSSGGWSGSSGGWSGSNGSTGSIGTYASSGGNYATGSSGVSYGGWGASYLNTAPNETGYVVEESYPVGDYGFVNGYPIEGSIVPGSGIMGSGPIPDGGPIGPMLEGGIQGIAPVEGGTVTPQNESPGPVEEGNSTSLEPSGDDSIASNSSVLNVVLPAEAKVFINERLTQTPGAYRSYRSSNLSLNRDYKYRVKAVLQRNGKDVVETKIVTLRPGADRTVRFDFDDVAEPVTEAVAVVTKLALTVPVDAKVILCGKKMKHTGVVRNFETTTLEPGKLWKGYKVEVEFERDGQLVKEERTLDMIGGKTHSMAIGVVDATDQVASN